MSDLAVRHTATSERTTGLTQTRESPWAVLCCALCGVGLLWVVGFAEIDALHNLAHDTRHSALFPCH